MSKIPAEEKVDFLLQVLSSCGDIKPDYQLIATKLGINTKSNAQRRFKSVVECDKKFSLMCSKDTTSVVDLNDSGVQVAVKASRSSKKRKNKDDSRPTDDANEALMKKAKAEAQGSIGDVHEV